MKQSGKQTRRVLWRGIVVVLGWGVVTGAQFTAPAAPQRPWWDRFPTIVQAGDAEDVDRCHAIASLCGAADDPCWGIQAQRVRHASVSGRVQALHERGLKALTWVEAFGTTQAYIVQLQRDDKGSWIRSSVDASIPRIFRNAWGWREFDGSGEVRWLGTHTYFDPDDVPGPYTLAHPRYGCVPMTYPDGRQARGFATTAAQPWTHRVFDAGCAKTILGKPYFDAAELNHGATVGMDGSDVLAVVPDPGFTPEEWIARRKNRLRGMETVRFSIGKDTACPVWNHYTRASIRQVLDFGIDGVWADNVSPWDSLNACPLYKAFGEWSVAAFREHLRTTFSVAELRALGIANAQHFDVREYLRQRCREWGGTPENLRNRVWRDPRWLDEPIWRAYLICKRRLGTRALTGFYRTIKEEAAAAGKPDFLVMGNDLPMFGLGWVRGELDMVSTELNWGWALSAGARGLMPPPLGSYVPVYKLAREHARSRFVNVWMYVPKSQLGRSGLARVLHYQGLATHTLPMPHQPHRRDAGSVESDTAFFGFVRKVAPTFADRLPVEEVGLYFSTSSQLAIMTPQGVLDFNRQVHAFSFWGWGTALTWLHAPWRAVPEWKLTPDTLAGLRVFVLPSAEVFPAADVPVLAAWVRAGGILIVAGECGSRLGEVANFARIGPGESTLQDLTAGANGAGRAALGQGQVLLLAPDPGLPFYLAKDKRPAMLQTFREVLGDPAVTRQPWCIHAPDVPWHVGLTPYLDATAGRFFVDVNTTRIDLETDTVTPTPELSFEILPPPDLRGKPLTVRALGPGAVPAVRLEPLAGGRFRLHTAPVALYISLVIETN